MGKKHRQQLEQKVENGELSKKHISQREWLKRMKEAFGDWGDELVVRVSTTDF